MKKLIIGIIVIGSIIPGAYNNYREYKNKLPELAGILKEKERNSDNMAKKIAYSPGHGKNTKNKVAPDGTPEWVGNRKVCDYLGKELKNNGFATKDLTGGEKEEDIPRTVRAKVANSWGADIIVAVHHNAKEEKPTWQKTSKGIETWYTSQKGKKLATLIQKCVIQETKQKSRGAFDASSKKWTILEATNMPAALIELGFEDNFDDYNLIYKSKDDWYPKACAKGICMGICDYFGMKYKPLSEDSVNNIILEVKEFQKQNDLVVDGIIGPKTWAVLMEYRNGYIDLYNGLDELQERLNVMKG